MSARALSTLLLSLALASGVLFVGHALARSEPVTLPDPAHDAPLAKAHGTRTAVFAGGCFWGVEAVFEHVKGVTDATSGYSGGMVAQPGYEQVSGGGTGHAESVRVTYDPAVVSYGQLLKVFFSVAHDPTQLNRQGPDVGTQYRSVVFAADAAQAQLARQYIAQLDAAHAFAHPIVTAVEPLRAFYPAEAYHQDYARKHPDNPYIAYNDAPKVAALKALWPALYVAR